MRYDMYHVYRGMRREREREPTRRRDIVNYNMYIYNAGLEMAESSRWRDNFRFVFITLNSQFWRSIAIHTITNHGCISRNNAGGTGFLGSLIILQHNPVYTLGQGSTIDNLKFDADNPPHPLFRIERGGEVTYHGPGQLVMYPILNLRLLQTDLHWYLRNLEETIIR